MLGVIAALSLTHAQCAANHQASQIPVAVKPVLTCRRMHKNPLLVRDEIRVRAKPHLEITLSSQCTSSYQDGFLQYLETASIQYYDFLKPSFQNVRHAVMCWKTTCVTLNVSPPLAEHHERPVSLPGAWQIRGLTHGEIM